MRTIIPNGVAMLEVPVFTTTGRVSRLSPDIPDPSVRLSSAYQ
ncbi:hypothetical protein [Austwickia sp. TVS 96-490-7B]|nr:hypothetical protein [Austwickia sp. TVS 96-490-7B]